MQSEDEPVVDGPDDDEPHVDISTTLLFDESDERILVALRIVGAGKRLEDIDRAELSAMARASSASIARCLDIISRARLFEDGELHDDVERYLKVRAVAKMNGTKKRQRR